MSGSKYLREFSFAHGKTGLLYSLPALEQAGFDRIPRLPVSLRIILESLLRHLDGPYVTAAHLDLIGKWQPDALRKDEVPFMVGRVLLQDFTGVPLLCDLTAMRAVAVGLGCDPRRIEPHIRVDMVVDHSVQVDYFKEANSLNLNMQLEFKRNVERYRFLKWSAQAFTNLHITPPGLGIVHQVNLEYLAPGLIGRGMVYLPDTLVGTDSHTPMINALGVLGWGVGGIEAEAAMLGLPISLLVPDVVGVHLTGKMVEGVTATDAVLTITERLREACVVGCFVEFFGAGAAYLTVPDRATIANMAPEYGATVGFFPPDKETIAYLKATGREPDQISAFHEYFLTQHMFGMPQEGEIDYSRVIQIDLGNILPCVAGPGRPQDRIPLAMLNNRFDEMLALPVQEGGYGKSGSLSCSAHPATAPLAHGSILIAAITSCTNTSNPHSMVTAGLLAQKAVARGLTVAPRIKTSLAPGSRVVTDYLDRLQLLQPLQQLGFRIVAYGCTTCIGNSGPLPAGIEQEIEEHDLICAAVLSGNRNFDARIHPSIRANFLMSPALVVAFALAGRVTIDISREPIAIDHLGEAVYLSEIWPSEAEIRATTALAEDPNSYRRLYRVQDSAPWADIAISTERIYHWPPSSYIANPPFFDDFSMDIPVISDIHGARALGIFGDSITTDHISPAGNISADSPAGQYLLQEGVGAEEFNSYGARRGNHEVMIRGTFANIRIRNLMLPPAVNGELVTGGVTISQPDGQQGFIYDVAMNYQAKGVPTLIFAGSEYGTGSSRDWAAKGTKLLGVCAVIACSFERIHRANLVGMGVLPLQFTNGNNSSTLGLHGDELFDLEGLEHGLQPGQEVILSIHYPSGTTRQCSLLMRIDTLTEAEYYQHKGILPYMLRTLCAQQT